MGLQKEREAFEAWISEVCPHVKMDLNAKTECEYDSSSMSLAWYAWQAAKASAVPDGYVVVPKEPTAKMIDATWDYDDEIQNMSHNSRNEFIYKAMIEAAQEQDQ